MLGKDPSAFGTFSVNGQTVTGQANKVTGFTAFSNDPNEQEGYFYGTSIEPWEGAQLRSSRNPERWADFKDDGNAVIFLGKESPSETEWYEVKDPGGAILRYTFDVTAAEAIRAPLSPISADLTKAKLKAIAADEGVELPEHVTKAGIVAAIQGARSGLRDS